MVAVFEDDARTVRRWLDEPRFRPRLCGARAGKLDPYKACKRSIGQQGHFTLAGQGIGRLSPLSRRERG